MTPHEALRIDEDAFLDDLHTLAQIGATPDGGVSRPAMSPDDVEGRAWLQNAIESAGLRYEVDGAGNQSAILDSPTPDAPTVLFGSHIDSVPNGGRFDGALGTLSALAALRAIKGAGIVPPVNLEVIAFTDEEGSLFGMFGSRAFAGLMQPEDFDKARDPAALADGMARLGMTRQSVLNAKRDPATVKAFVELHIEQGTRLEFSGTDIGVVTNIVGIRWQWLRFRGVAAHAGTMPMSLRQDALWAATDFITAARDLVMADFSPGVMNCGSATVAPGAFNIVPAAVDLALEFRHGTDTDLDAMETELTMLAQDAADQNDVELAVVPALGIEPAVLSETVIGAIERAADTVGVSHTRLMSFAGHDTQSVNRIAPSAMFFVPSVNGISHNPAEFTRPEDCINGANVVLQAVLGLAFG